MIKSPLFKVLFLLIATTLAAQQNIHWPSFRGHNASGIAEGYPTPKTWDVEARKNVKWQTTIKGLGHSCPVIWDQFIFLTSAISGKKDYSIKTGVYGSPASTEDTSIHKWVLYCLDKNSGKILWQKIVHTGVPTIKRHLKSTHANSTPATNGKYVVAFFGSEGLYCFDIKGKLVWKKNFGVLDSGAFSAPDAQWGFGSSPIIYKNRVIVQCDVQGEDFIAAFDIKDGKQLWKTLRDEVPTWSTPTIFHSKNTTQIVVNGYRQIAGYDFQSGKQIWHIKGGGDVPVATPVVGHGLVFITNHHGGKTPIYAIKLDNLSKKNKQSYKLVWYKKREGAYLQTPIVYGDYFYCSKYGRLRCFKATSGELMYKTRLDMGAFTASPVAANGMLYFTSERGTVFVIQAGPKYKVLAKNKLGAICMASPAISEGVLFFRTRKYLVAISKENSLQKKRIWKICEEVLKKHGFKIKSSKSKESIVAFSFAKDNFLNKARIKIICKITALEPSIHVINQVENNSKWINVGRNGALETEIYNEIVQTVNK